MPLYLLHENGDGLPVGVFTPSADYYDPAWDQLREEGREVVYSKLAHVPWPEFVERLADTMPSETMRWDTFLDSNASLEIVLRHAQAQVEQTGAEEEE